MSERLESPEEIQEYLIEQADSPGGEEARKFELSKAILNGEIIILEKDQPEALTKEDVRNIDDIEYLSKKFGPLKKSPIENKSLISPRLREEDNLEFFSAPSSEGTNEKSFSTGGLPSGVIYYNQEYGERVLEAYAKLNDIELGPESKNGSSWAMKIVISGTFENENNWLKYRDPVGWINSYHTVEYDIWEDVKDPEMTYKDLADKLGTSDHFAKVLFEYHNEKRGKS